MKKFMGANNAPPSTNTAKIVANITGNTNGPNNIANNANVANQNINSANGNNGA